jgi:hypothetical protein
MGLLRAPIIAVVLPYQLDAQLPEACTSSWHKRGAYRHHLSSYALLGLAAFRAHGARSRAIQKLAVVIMYMKNTKEAEETAVITR